ncbi:glycosyltransferase [Dysgonomonas macrotermitis]|uniref:Glycosyltransferase involved in cell wall bisynthesis n=1 Tax=Dysgonomonas macrotermitis TaxID=1346286 RepID=A0A1M5FSP6_9BACT|nr:glycosyltransferase [Dysgonomonas macrotermitis]SHF94496.1 Glycosyltransferase involved in cell wall bisynthesis [Dysgonomonas macrotermitis]
MDENKNITIVACYFGPKLGVGVFIEKLLSYLLPLLKEGGYNITLVTNTNVLEHSPLIDTDGIEVVCPEELQKTISSKAYFLNTFPDTSYVKDAKYVLFTADSVIGKGVKNAISVVHDINEFDVHNKFGIIRTWFRKRMIRSVISRACKIVVISGFVKDQIIKYFPNEQFDGRLSVIHNGIDLVESEDLSVTHKQKEPYFLIVGRIDPKGKKLYEALKIYQAYKSQNPEFELKIVGGINRFCEKEANSFLLDANRISGVQYLGYVEDKELNALYESAFATIFYSEFEGFGFPILEAFGRGCPVITNPANKVNDELANGYDVKIAESDLNNVEMICWKVDLIRKMDTEVLKATALRFSWKKTARQYFDLLND